MNNCLYCKKPLTHSEGRREKKYCNNNCRQAFWQKKKPKEAKTKVLTMDEWEEIQKKLKAIEKKEIKIQDATQPTDVIKPIELPKTNFTINTTEEVMPEGLNWKEEIQWYRNHKK